MGAFLIAALALLAGAGPAQAEPFSLTALFSTILFSAPILGSVTVGTVASIALTVGVTIAQSIFSSNRQTATTSFGGSSGSGFQASGSAINGDSARLSQLSAMPSQRVIYGRAEVGGAYFMRETRAPYLYFGLLIASHEIDGVEKLMMQSAPVALDAAGVATDQPYARVGESLLKVSYRLGKRDQDADPIITSDLSYGAAFRQRGHATAVFKLAFGADREDNTRVWSTSGPDPKMLVRGRRIFDPRDPTQSVDDAATWRWSNNAALVIADYLTAEFGFAFLASKIDRAALIHAANVCDQQVAGAAGTTHARYTIDGVIDKTSSQHEVLKGMLTACGGMVAKCDGRYHIIVAERRDPVKYTITDDMLLGAVAFRGVTPRASRTNVVRTAYVDPDQNYQTVNGPVLKDEAAIARDGREHDTTIRLPFTLGVDRAQRLGNIHLASQQDGRLLTLRTDIRGLVYAPGDVVRFESNLFAYASGLYRVTAAETAPDLWPNVLTLAGYDPAAFEDA